MCAQQFCKFWFWIFSWIWMLPKWTLARHYCACSLEWSVSMLGRADVWTGVLLLLRSGVILSLATEFSAVRIKFCAFTKKHLYSGLTFRHLGLVLVFWFKMDFTCMGKGVFSLFCFKYLIMCYHFSTISRWNQPACPFTRLWSQLLITRHTSAYVRPRDAVGQRTSTPVLRSGPLEKPLFFWWSASARWSCWEVFSPTKRPLQHVSDHNTLQGSRM